MAQTDDDFLTDRINRYPSWSPRIWTGFCPWQYWQLLAENRFRIHPSRYAMTGLVSFWALWNSVFAAGQRVVKGTAIANTKIEQPPIFLLGHWRCGTTLLHELMSLDEQMAYPQNYDTFVPHHFLVSGWVLRPILRMLIPRKRPMDDMPVSLESPQEDEFALMILGASSGYRRIAFPHSDQPYFRWFDSANLNVAQLDRLRVAAQYFVRALTLKYKKRLVLKSPPHTGRIRDLASWFPDAKFVHISRHPYQVVPSTIRLWKITDELQSFQKQRYSTADLLSYVNECQQVMYRAYFRDRLLLNENQLVEIKYEDLIERPAPTLQLIYDRLELSGVEPVIESVQAYFQERKSHQPNRLNIDAIAECIDEHWSEYMAYFQYEKVRQPKFEPV
jgi:hypothetical protein